MPQKLISASGLAIGPARSENRSLTGNCLRALLMLTVLRHVGMLVFLTSLSSAHTLSTGSVPISSYIIRQHVCDPRSVASTHRDCDQQARALDLAHVRYPPRVVRLEPLDHLPALAHDADHAILRTEEQAVGARAYARDVAALEELLCLLIGEGDLGDFEEVKRLPLDTGVRGAAGAASRDLDVPKWPCCRIGEQIVVWTRRWTSWRAR